MCNKVQWERIIIKQKKLKKVTESQEDKTNLLVFRKLSSISVQINIIRFSPIKWHMNKYLMIDKSKEFFQDLSNIIAAKHTDSTAVAFLRFEF